MCEIINSNSTGIEVSPLDEALLLFIKRTFFKTCLRVINAASTYITTMSNSGIS